MNKKDLLQKEVVNLSESFPFLLLEHCTGAGKTLSALKIIEQSNSKKDWVIVIAERAHETNWKDDIQKHKKTRLLDRIKFVCYASFHKLQNAEINLIMDEGHHLSDNNAKTLSTIKPEQCIILTAKLTPKELESYENALKVRFYKHRYPISQAVEDGLLPEPKIIVYRLWLDNVIKRNKIQYKKDGKVVGEKMVTDQEYYDYLESRIAYFKNIYTHKPTAILHNIWMQQALKRKNFMAYVKQDIAEKILKMLREFELRFICYHNTVKDAKKLGLKGTAIFSEGRTFKTNAKIIENFNTFTINELNTNKMVQEGMNFTKIEAGLLVQLDNKSRKGIQTTGRTLRSELPIMLIIHLGNTQDDVYLANYIEDVNASFIDVVTNLEELRNHVRD
jgi:superfamily II DNA or RNA helicase